MALSVVDLYARILPRTNCGECGYRTCMAFAGMVVSQKLALAGCPHVSADILNRYQPELDAQHAAGQWTQRDLAADALTWAKQRAAGMDPAQLCPRIGGTLTDSGGEPVLSLPYFNTLIHISRHGIRDAGGADLGRWEQVFIYNHMAQGGERQPTGRWKALQEFPNTVSKIKSMRTAVETPLRQHFSGHRDDLAAAAQRIGGVDVTAEAESADLAIRLVPLPRIPVLLLFWEADREAGFEAEVKLVFDETITEHLDIESIIFLSEHLVKLLLD